jgi:hypothetical protein
MLEMFGRLYGGQDMPASERVPSGHGRDRRAVTRIAVAFAVAALALSILFSAALTTPARSGAPASGHRPPSPSAPGRVLQSGGITIKLVIRGTSAGFADAR